MSGYEVPAFSHDPSATAAFAALSDLQDSAGSTRQLEDLHAVVIGGGTGAPVAIRTLLSMGVQTSAVVAMADDGGSTGILRDAVGATTPGDIRKCLTAMAQDANDAFTQAFKTRLAFVGNHTLGNLILSTLETTAGGFPEAIACCERMLHARGHVYPSTLDRVTLMAKTSDGRTIEGQAVACHSRSALSRVMLSSENSITAYEPARNAIEQADIVVLGPGSLFTSIIPNLLVPGIVDAIRTSKAQVIFVCSLADMQGETRGLTALQHYRALCAHGMENLVDVMLIQDPEISAEYADESDTRIRMLRVEEGDIQAIQAARTRPLVCDLRDDVFPTWHDPEKLRLALIEAIETDE